MDKISTNHGRLWLCTRYFYPTFSTQCSLPLCICIIKTYFTIHRYNLENISFLVLSMFSEVYYPSSLPFLPIYKFKVSRNISRVSVCHVVLMTCVLDELHLFTFDLQVCFVCLLLIYKFICSLLIYWFVLFVYSWSTSMFCLLIFYLQIWF